jgi:mevalonate kinase
MKWMIPAKTFLLGEYVAITGGPAIVLTTTPCFELHLSDSPGLHGIHPESPAGRWWLAHGSNEKGLEWYDPYQGLGGMGASSAQFVGAYYATLVLQNKTSTKQDLLEAYWHCAWTGQGLRPSGYDVLAQSGMGCAYIHDQKHIEQTLSWSFEDIGFILLHTEKKLPTHQHLLSQSIPQGISGLAATVALAKEALEQSNAAQMIRAINDYHQQLLSMDLVAAHSLKCMELLKDQVDVLAMKGCGALGADVLLLLVACDTLPAVTQKLASDGWHILATNADLLTEKVEQ